MSATTSTEEQPSGSVPAVGTTIIAVRDIGKAYGSVIALNGISTTVNAGEVTCVLGDNGAGKSTFIKILAGAHAHSQGELLVDGRPTRFSSPREALDAGIATVYQDLAVVPLMPVWRNFFLGSELTKGRGPLRRLDVPSMKRIAKEELAAMGIDLRDVDQPIGTLSGGERQCVAIARAVYFGARVLILDEPTAALGVRQSGVVLKYVAKARDRGLGVILITHNPHHAYPVGDRFVLLRRGRSMGDYPKSDLTLDELVQMMAGGAELEALSHELSRQMPDSEVARELEEGVAETITMDTAPAEGPDAGPETPDVVTRDLGVAVVGFGWMGEVHSRAWARLLHHYPGSGVRPRLVAVADPEASRRERATDAYGYAAAYEDWAALLQRDDVDVVSVCGPNFVHREIGVAVAESGRHLWVEKPAGRSAEDASAIAAAVRKAGVMSAVGFNYRNAPAVEAARALVAEGRLGRVESVEVRMLADYSAHPDGALSWRFDPAYAGTGVLGDLASHGFDLATYVGGEAVGAITELVADQHTFITERPVVTGAVSHFARGGDGPRGPVGNEDQVAALLRFASGAGGYLTASRVAVGEQSAYAVEVRGTAGALAWDFRRMGELRLCLDQDFQDATWRTHLVGPPDGDLAAFQPGAGNAMGYDDLKVVEAHRLARSIVTGTPEGATIDDVVVTAALIDAMVRSYEEKRWVSP